VGGLCDSLDEVRASAGERSEPVALLHPWNGRREALTASIVTLPAAAVALLSNLRGVAATGTALSRLTVHSQMWGYADLDALIDAARAQLVFRQGSAGGS
jgi:hypothetical protein